MPDILSAHRSCALAAHLLAAAGAAADFTIDDIEFWAGAGEQQAGFVIDFVDGRPPLAWGYRWDGAAVGLDVIEAVAAADPNLYVKVTAPGAFGVAVIGFGYDADADGFALTDGSRFVDGVAVGEPSDDAAAVDPDDRYVEGWAVNGFWGYWVGVDPYAAGAWGFAPTGPSDRELEDGDWDGWAFAPGFSGAPPAEPMAAPAPPPACPADLDENGVVDAADLNLLLADFGCVGCRAADVDADGVVGAIDLNLLLAEFGTVCG